MKNMAFALFGIVAILMGKFEEYMIALAVIGILVIAYHAIAYIHKRCN